MSESKSESDIYFLPVLFQVFTVAVLNLQLATHSPLNTYRYAAVYLFYKHVLNLWGFYKKSENSLIFVSRFKQIFFHAVHGN